MNEMTKTIIDKGEYLATLKNRKPMMIRNQGILFGTYLDGDGNAQDEAWVITDYATVRWSDCGKLDFPEERPFFSYADGEFMKNETSFSDIRELRKLYEERTRDFTENNIMRGKVDVVPIPINNLINRINRIYDPRMHKIERSRTIFKNNNGFVFEGELILAYDEKNDVFFHKSIDVPFIPHKSSHKEGPFKDGQMYRTVIVDEVVRDGQEIGLIDVRDEYFKGIEIGIHEVYKGTYFPDSEKEIIDFSLYPEERILRYKYPMEPLNGTYSFNPIHIETPTLYYVLMIMEGFDFFNMYVDTTTRVKPLLFESVRDGKEGDYPLIEAIVGPLKPEIRGYHL
jgi:hypothetical protein